MNVLSMATVDASGSLRHPATPMFWLRGELWARNFECLHLVIGVEASNALEDLQRLQLTNLPEFITTLDVWRLMLWALRVVRLKWRVLLKRRSFTDRRATNNGKTNSQGEMIIREFILQISCSRPPSPMRASQELRAQRKPTRLIYPRRLHYRRR
jgi:hypothetical protein